MQTTALQKRAVDGRPVPHIIALSDLMRKQLNSRIFERIFEHGDQQYRRRQPNTARIIQFGPRSSDCLPRQPPSQT